MFRHGSYVEKLAEELQDLDFAREYLLSLMEGEEGMSLFDALAHTIRRMGIKEFSDISGINTKSISRMLNSSSIPKIETFDQYLAPFGLRTKIETEEVA